MSLPHALLTALIDRPDSGSELASRFDRSLGYFWAATHQQIYRELARMEEAGWVASLPEQAGRGRKRAYRVTRRGRAELVRWIDEPLAPRPLREELMVRLRAEGAVGPTGGALTGHIRAWLAQHEATQALYDQSEARGYTVNFLTGAKNSKAFDGGGLPPSPVAGIVNIELEDGTEVQQPFVIGTPDGQGADGSSALGVARPIIPIPTTKRRTYWCQVKDR